MFPWVMKFPLAMGNRVDVHTNGRVFKFISHEGDLGEPEPREIPDTPFGEAFRKKARNLGFPV